MPELTRRDVLKVGAGGAALGGLSALGFDVAVAQATTVKQDLRIEGAKVSRSVCPYCAVGCALLAYTRKTRNGKVELLQIEGDPDSPVNEGTLCPKGASAMELAVSKPAAPAPALPGARRARVASGSPGTSRSTGWPSNIKASRDRTFVTKDDDGNVVNRSRASPSPAAPRSATRRATSPRS